MTQFDSNGQNAVTPEEVVDIAKMPGSESDSSAARFDASHLQDFALLMKEIPSQPEMHHTAEALRETCVTEAGAERLPVAFRFRLTAFAPGCPRSTPIAKEEAKLAPTEPKPGRLHLRESSL